MSCLFFPDRSAIWEYTARGVHSTLLPHPSHCPAPSLPLPSAIPCPAQSCTMRPLPPPAQRHAQCKSSATQTLLADLAESRRAATGSTHVRGGVDHRGRKSKISSNAVRKLNRVRKQLISKVQGERETRWRDILKEGRAPKVHRATALRAFRRAGLDIKARRPAQLGLDCVRWSLPCGGSCRR